MRGDVSTLNEVFAALPSLNGDVVTVGNGGNLGRQGYTSFIKRVSSSLNPGQVLRISGISSGILVDSRASNAGRCCFAWLSSYGDGSQLRTNALIFYSPPKFKWFVNGSSELCTFYIKNTFEINTDYFNVIAMDGSYPTLEVVDSVPSDATPLVNDLNR